MRGILRTYRLENLTDGVYSIAMTLLVLTIEVPGIPKPITSAKLLSALGEMGSLFMAYGLSFYILASLWIAHNQQFSIIKYSDMSFVWINLVGLFLIFLVPFSTDMVGTFSGIWVADAFFHLHMMAIGLIFFWQSYYVLHYNLYLEDAGEKKELEKEKRTSLALPIAALLGLVLTPFTPGYSSMAYLAIPLFLKRLLSR